MTGRRPIPDRVPLNLYGRPKRDLTMRFYEKFVGAYIKTSTLINRRDVVSKVSDDSMTVVVRERRVEAHDENVISLVLVDPGGGELPAWRPGAHLDLCLPSAARRRALRSPAAIQRIAARTALLCDASPTAVVARSRFTTP